MISSDNQKKVIGLRIKEARSALGLTQKELCDRADMKLPSLRDYELGNRIPGGDAVSDLARIGINTNWLLTGDGPMFISELIVDAIDDLKGYHSLSKILDDVRSGRRVLAEEPAPPEYIDGDSVFIDKYVNVNGSAGPGAEVHEEAIVKVRVDLRLLRERIGNNFGKIKIASVSGDSMEPTLSHGDQVLVDTSCSRFIDDAIYAIQQDGHLRFKRIQLKLDGTIVVKSDGALNIETYSADEASRFFVVGIVIPFKFGRFKI